MRPEDKNREYKSLRKAVGSKANHRSLAETCVCFANAQGGEIIIGIEDGNDAPPPTQSLNQKDMNKLIKSLRELTDGVGLVGPEIKKSELPDGMFRKNIRHYPREVVRELLVNAIAHKKYTISGDLFIEVYPDKMKITNPGGLPLGITSGNILHQRHRRNPHLIQLMSALNLMEGEGSGYDMVYERLARDAKPLPIVESDFLNTSVTVASGIINPTIISILDYVDKHFTLTQKEYITLGIVAAAKKIRTTQLAQKLQLEQEDRMRSWMGTLIDKAILIKHGERKGTNYLLNPKLFEQAKIDVVPSLKTMEPYKLEALVREDLKYNGISKMTEIKKRLEGIPAADIQKTVYSMVDKGVLTTHGGKRNRTYQLVKNNKIKIKKIINHTKNCISSLCSNHRL